jgi:hypothetical protein
MPHSIGLIVPLEVAAVVLVVLVALWRRGKRATVDAELDVPERLRESLSSAGIPDRAANLLATEAAILYYALASWRRRPFVPGGAAAFSYHRRNAYASMLYAVFGVALVEMAAVDLIVRVHHVTAANVLLVVDALAAIWMLGFARAVQLRPILVTHDAIVIHNGLAATLEIPLANAMIEFGRVRAPDRGTAGYFRAGMGQPNAPVTLREPTTLRRSYGASRAIERTGLILDDPKAFEAAWNARRPHLSMVGQAEAVTNLTIN